MMLPAKLDVNWTHWVDGCVSFLVSFVGPLHLPHNHSTITIVPASRGCNLDPAWEMSLVDLEVKLGEVWTIEGLKFTQQTFFGLPTK